MSVPAILFNNVDLPTLCEPMALMTVKPPGPKKEFSEKRKSVIEVSKNDHELGSIILVTNGFISIASLIKSCSIFEERDCTFGEETEC